MINTKMSADDLPAFLQLLAHDVRWQLLRALAQSDCRVQELVEQVARPMNLVSYHLRKLRQLDLVRERRSSADGRDVYYSLDLERLRALFQETGAGLHPTLACSDAGSVVEPVELSHPVRVLFLCTRNSARSQMAEGMLRHLSKGQVDAHSAGSEPAQVHPYAVRAMAELGIDIRRQKAKHMGLYADRHVDYVVTVCDIARENCPPVSDVTASMHWSIQDLVGDGQALRYEDFVAVAADLQVRVGHLLARIAASQANLQRRAKCS